MKILTLFIILTVIMSTGAVAQNKTMISWGIENALPKYSVTKFDKDYVYLDDIGSVATLKRSIPNWNFYEDADLFLHIDKDHWEFKFAAGLFSQKIKINTETIDVDYISYDVYSLNSGIRLGSSIGYKLSGKRAAQLYISSGINFDAVKFTDDYNPINYGIKSFTYDPVLSTVYDQNFYPIYKRFYMPPLSLVSALDLHLYGNIFSVIGEYKNRAIGFGNSQNALYEYSYLIKFQWAIILGYKYK